MMGRFTVGVSDGLSIGSGKTVEMEENHLMVDSGAITIRRELAPKLDDRPP